jgi:hypothetical protein
MSISLTDRAIGSNLSTAIPVSINIILPVIVAGPA